MLSLFSDLDYNQKTLCEVKISIQHQSSHNMKYQLTIVFFQDRGSSEMVLGWSHPPSTLPHVSMRSRLLSLTRLSIRLSLTLFIRQKVSHTWTSSPLCIPVFARRERFVFYQPTKSKLKNGPDYQFVFLASSSLSVKNEYANIARLK